MSESETPKPASNDKPNETSAPGKPSANGKGRNEQRQRRERRGTNWLALIALIVAVVALVGAGMLGWSWYELRGQQARIPQLAGRVSELSGQVAALRSAKADTQNLNALTEQLHDLSQSMQLRLKTVSEALHRVSSRLAGAGNAYQIDQAVALMRLAQIRLNLAHDPAGAARALHLADQTLASINNPALATVHTTLQREIAALKAVPKVDVGGLYVHIEQLAGSVISLPLAGAAISRPPAPATASPDFGWDDIGAAFKRAFSSLVVIRHGPVAQPLLPPEQAWFLRQNVQLALASAQLALMQRNPQAWRASLGRAAHWLNRWFLTSDAKVQQALKTLSDLAATDIAPELPTLGAALAQLASIRAQLQPQPASPTTAPTPASR